MSLRGRHHTVVHSTTLLEFLIVTSGQTHFAIQADAVRNVTQPEEGDVEAVLASFGITMAPVHLAEHFGLTGSYLSPDSRILVCGMQGVHVAIRVDRVLGLHDIESTKIKPLLPHFVGPERRWIAGMFLFQQTVALVLHTGWLLSDDRASRAISTTVLEPTLHPHSSMPPSPTVIEASVSRSRNVDWNAMEFEEATDADDTPWAQI